MKYRRVAAACAAAALTVLTATSAYADDVYNDLDGTIDATHEAMELTLVPGTPGTTELSIRETSGSNEHPNCNIQGDPWTVSVTASYDTGVVLVDFPNGATFADCDSVVSVRVTPVAVGSTSVVFAYTSVVPPGGQPRTFDVSHADFDVTVLPGGDGTGGQICDADPAAPAWAAALLKGNNVKAPGKVLGSYVSAVAQHMGPRATFDNAEKWEHTAYEDAVFEYMNGTLQLGLTKGPRHADVVKPGWACTQLVGTAATS